MIHDADRKRAWSWCRNCRLLYLLRQLVTAACYVSYTLSLCLTLGISKFSASSSKDSGESSCWTRLLNRVNSWGNPFRCRCCEFSPSIGVYATLLSYRRNTYATIPTWQIANPSTFKKSTVSANMRIPAPTVNNSLKTPATLSASDDVTPTSQYSLIIKQKTKVAIAVIVTETIKASCSPSFSSCFHMLAPSIANATGNMHIDVVGAVYSVAFRGDMWWCCWFPDSCPSKRSLCVVAHRKPPKQVDNNCNRNPHNWNSCPSPMEARTIPNAIVSRQTQTSHLKLSKPKRSPHPKVKMGAIPLRMVPKETVSNSKAKLEHPISIAVMIPIGRTYFVNWVLDRGSWGKILVNKSAKMEDSMLEYVVTIKGYGK